MANSVPQPHHPSEPPRQAAPPSDNRPLIAHLVYGLYALTYVTGISSVVGVVFAYLARDRAAGSWLGSHNSWQIRTFWYGLLFQVVGWITVWILIGWLILFAGAIWFAWRIAKGWIRLANERPVEDPTSFV